MWPKVFKHPNHSSPALILLPNFSSLSETWTVGAKPNAVHSYVQHLLKAVFSDAIGTLTKYTVAWCFINWNLHYLPYLENGACRQMASRVKNVILCDRSAWSCDRYISHLYQVFLESSCILQSMAKAGVTFRSECNGGGLVNHTRVMTNLVLAPQDNECNCALQTTQVWIQLGTSAAEGDCHHSPVISTLALEPT